MDSSITEDTVEYKEWKRVKCDDGKQRTKLLNTQKDTQTFTDAMTTEFENFKNHASRVKAQYMSFKQMKESLKENKKHVCVQMDFAENYSVKEMEEIQSAYWNPESVTLHPVVIYFAENDKVTHSSMVVVSEVLNHNSSMVKAILEKVILRVRQICPSVQFIHYWTDSPTSQYRNKMMFDAVAQHPATFGLKASWHYFEAGHGKGACDGTGGAVKRSADTAIKIGKVNIACGKDFYEWGLKSDSKIRYEFVDKSEYENSDRNNELRQKYVNTVKGTMQVHAVAGVSTSEVMVRDTTCICSECFTHNGFVWSEANICGWKKHSISNNKPGESKQPSNSGRNVEKKQQTRVENQVTEAVNTADKEESNTDQVTKGDFVAAMYDDEAYVGKVVDIDEGLYQVTFMEKGSKVKDCLKWPAREDKIWIEPEDVICKVTKPISTGKGMRFFKLTDKDIQIIENLNRK